ncbi:MAG: hypothetical protein KC649_06890, partial [Candidatus Omnitrophica bacterium]|nr:hypothetical protein [Candidatus Omnitrophota bacterium]
MPRLNDPAKELSVLACLIPIVGIKLAILTQTVIPSGNSQRKERLAQTDKSPVAIFKQSNKLQKQCYLTYSLFKDL